MMPEDLFLKNKFLHIPKKTHWEVLRNITVDLSNNSIKLYFYNSSQDFFIKYDANKSFKQFIVNRNGIDYYPLSKFLGHKFNLDDIIVDTIELNNGIYFLSISETNPNQYISLLEYLLKSYDIEHELFFNKVNQLNGTSISNLMECYEQKCIDVIRLSIHKNRFKIYSRTFRYHHFKVPSQIMDFLSKVFDDKPEKLQNALDAGGMSYDFSDNRIQLFTQHEIAEKTA